MPASPRDSWQALRRVDPVPGTPFGLVYLDVAPVTSGPAVAALVTGIYRGPVLAQETAFAPQTIASPAPAGSAQPQCTEAHVG